MYRVQGEFATVINHPGSISCSSQQNTSSATDLASPTVGSIIYTYVVYVRMRVVVCITEVK